LRETDPRQPSTSRAARDDAVRSIPIEKLDPPARTKVAAILADVSLFRRMPVKVIDCDPSLYLFLVRHPDVVVNIWEVLEISNLRLREVAPRTYQVIDTVGTRATVEVLYSSHDTQVIYATGSYSGPLLARPVQGRCLLLLRNGYVRETNGRHYITSRLDTFMQVDNGGIELLAKTLQPLMGKTADNNFEQTMAFLGSLSRTAEVNSRGVQRLASKLEYVQPQYRDELAKLAATLGEGPRETVAAKPTAGSVQVADRPGAKPQ
jgi:hypothetical protein